MYSSDEEYINEIIRKDKESKGLVGKKGEPCTKCGSKILLTCGCCDKVRCKTCTQHWQCPGCEKWFCEKECCANGSGGLYYCNGCGVICEGCLPFLYEDFTLMDTCCGDCKKRIPPFYRNIKEKLGSGSDDDDE